MSKKTFKNVNINLPETIADSISEKDIIKILIDKALTKKEYYHSKCLFFENKYKTKFADFEQRVENSSEEKFNEWDNLIVWQGYNEAYNDWDKKLKELKRCMK